MQEQRYILPASVLATVLVVSTLMLLGVLLVMNLWDMDLTRYYLFHREEQWRANVESGFLLYSLDSTLQGRWEEDSTILLFDGQEVSRVGFTRERWGMYEAVSVRAGAGRKRSTRLVGKVVESDKRAALYIPENGRSFSLTGRTFLDGDVYLPRNGISYTQMRSEFFSGTAIPSERVYTSEGQFPEIEEETRELVRGLFSFSGERGWLENSSMLKRGFGEPVSWVEAGEYLSGVNVSGHVVLHVSGTLFIEQDNRLENVIVVGRKIEIADGFSGCLQVFARDTIILGDRVCLKAGSGLYVRGEAGSALLKLGEYVEVNGFVTVEGGSSEGEQKQASYVQPSTSRVRGLVYVDGIAEVHGGVTGSLYAKECYYFAPEGYYSGILYNAVVLGCEGIVYPLWMKGPYERGVVKWLD